MMSLRCLKTLVAPGLAVWTAAVVACAVRQPIRLDPFYQSFLEKARLIMTDEEIEFFVHLPDADSRAVFVEDFWKMRDPNPATPENENRLEFERRIKFANEWFGVLNQIRRMPAPPELHLDRGWKTDRGMAYIVMGPPDLISQAESGGIMEPAAPDDGYLLGKAAAWYYTRFRAQLTFQIFRPRENGLEGSSPEEFYLPASQSRMQSMTANGLEQAKEEWIYRDQPGGLGVPLRFTAGYRRGALEIAIPIKSVRFKEGENRSLSVAFEVEVRIYRDSRKVDTLSHRKEFVFPEKEAENLRQLELRIPYESAEKGSYLFEVIVKSDDPSILSRRRQTVRARL
jgi:GWxTD domain-containing protein